MWVSLGTQKSCSRCGRPKSDCHDSNVPPKNVSVSLRHGSASNGNAWNNEKNLATQLKQAKEAEKAAMRQKAAMERQLKEALAGRTAPTLAAEDDAEMEPVEVVEVFKHSIKCLRTLINAAVEDGCDPKTDDQILGWQADIKRQEDAKQAAKPVSQQLRGAEETIRKLENQHTQMQLRMQTLCDKLAAAQKAKDDHKEAQAAVLQKLVQARRLRAELGTKVTASSSTDPSSKVLSLLQAATDSVDGMPGELRTTLQAVMAKIEAEAAAKELAKTEAAAAEAAATAAANAQATADTAAATAPVTPTATTATTASAATPAPVPHSRPPPALEIALHAPKPGPAADGNSVLALFPDHCAESSGSHEISASDHAVLCRLGKDVVLAHYGTNRQRSRSPRAYPDI